MIAYNYLYVYYKNEERNRMKQQIQRIISNKKSVKSEELISLISNSNCEYVSFDIFDTLIKRNINKPDDLFLILEDHFNRYFNTDFPIAEMRKKAELDANSQAVQEDVNLNEIYKTMYRLTVEQRKWLINEEIRLEEKICQVNFNISKVYKWCRQNGKTIIIISDMYLPKSVIESILKSAGYSGWKSLYVSNDCGKRKSTGKLFELVLKNEKIDRNNIVHIGDALKGDYLMPLKLGFKAELIKTCEHDTLFYNKKYLKQERVRKHYTYNVLNSFVNNNINDNYGYFEKIGYEVIGPILYGYCNWLKDEAKVENIQDLFFLTREGSFLKRAFDVLNNDSFTTKLLRVSRHATSLPLLNYAQNLDELLNLITTSRSDFTITRLVNSLNLPNVNLKFLINEFGDSDIRKLDDVSKKKLFESIKPYIEELSYRQRENIKGYLKEKGFQGRVGVCDVGWHGTIQSNLGKVSPNTYIKGFYIGKKDKKNDIQQNASAYLFSNRKNENIKNEIMSAPDLFELFFLSTDGTALSYERDQHGQYFCRQAQPEQRKNNAEKIIRLQKSALKFLEDFNAFNMGLDLKLDPRGVEAAYSKLINPPSSRLINNLKEFSFLNVGTHSLISQHSIQFYIFNPNSLKADFLNSGSKSLFLKSILKLPLPYAKLIEFMRKFDND